jgi:hypothetical protein
MTQATVLILAGITSTAALWIGTQGLRLRSGDLALAVGKMLECLGMMLVFCLANAVLGLVAIIGGRSLTGAFVSTYAISDVTLLGISFIQGLLFYCWREAKAGRRNRGVRASRSDRGAERALIRKGD